MVSQANPRNPEMDRRRGLMDSRRNGRIPQGLHGGKKLVQNRLPQLDQGGATRIHLRIEIRRTRRFDNPTAVFYESRSEEHGSWIIEALETGRIYRGHFNVQNKGTITNLPDDAIIEAPGYVDKNGINTPKVGDLPLGCAAVCNTSVSVQRMAVEAAVHGDVDLLKQAFMMDPLVGAVCDPNEIWQMVDEMLVAQSQWLPQYRRQVTSAKARLKSEKPLGTMKTQGAARLKTRSIAQMQKTTAQSRKDAAASDKGNMTGPIKKPLNPRKMVK